MPRCAKRHALGRYLGIRLAGVIGRHEPWDIDKYSKWGRFSGKGTYFHDVALHGLVSDSDTRRGRQNRLQGSDPFYSNSYEAFFVIPSRGLLHSRQFVNPVALAIVMTMKSDFIVPG